VFPVAVRLQNLPVPKMFIGP